MSNAAYNYLVEVDAPNGTQYFARSHVVDTGQAYSERLLSTLTISKSVGTPDGGIQEIDDVRLSLDNSDGTLNDWFEVGGGANSPRGAAIRIYQRAYDDGAAKSLVFSGTVQTPSLAVDRDGAVTVDITAEADACESILSAIPTVLEHDTLGVAEAEVVLEDLGRAMPVIFGATREHVVALRARRAPTSDVYHYLAARDARLELCRTTVSTVYREGGDGVLRVVPAAEYLQSRSTYAGFVTLTFSRAQLSRIMFDAEATEFDTQRTGVKRHWLFRSRLYDEVAGNLLVPTTITLADWQLDASLADSSENNLPLLKQGSGSVVYVGTGLPEGGTAWYQAVFDDIDSIYFHASTTAADFDFNASQSWRIEVQLRVGASGPIEGYVCSKLQSGVGPGYVLYIQPSGALAAYLHDGTTAHTIVCSGNIQDGNWHRVVFSVNRTANTAQFIFDDVADPAVDITGFGSLVSTQILHVGGVPSIAWFKGQIARLTIYNSAFGDDVAYVNGQSAHGPSAADLTSVALREPDPSTDLNLGSAEDLVVMAWFKAATAPGSDEDIASWFTSSEGFALQIQGSTGYGIVKVGDGVDTASVTGATDLCDDAWHQLYLVLTRSDNLLRMYVDGVQRGASVDASAVGASSQSLDLTCAFTGHLDELMILRGSGVGLTAAQVRQQYYTATGNPVRMIRRIITDTDWGMSRSQALTVDATSFNSAEDTIAAESLVFGGALAEETEAREVLYSILRTYGMVLKCRGGSWEMTFSWQATAGSPFQLGFADGVYENILSLDQLQRTRLDEATKTLVVAYRLINDTSAGVYAQRTEPRNVNTAQGLNDLVIDLPFVRSWSTADRIGHFLAEWRKADRRMSLQVSSEIATATPGDEVRVNIARAGLSDAAFRVQSVQMTPEQTSLSLFEESTAALSYSPTTERPTLQHDDAPDLAATTPPPPSNLLLVQNDPWSTGTLIAITFDMPTGELADLLIRAAKVSWRVQDGDTDPSNEWQSELVVARSGTTVRYQRRDLLPGETYILRVESLSFFDQLSVPAQQGDQTGLPTTISVEGDSILQFTAANNLATSSRSNPGLDARIAVLEVGGGAVLAGYMTQTAGGDLSEWTLPTSPTDTNSIIVVYVQGRPLLPWTAGGDPPLGYFKALGTNGDKDCKLNPAQRQNYAPAPYAIYR